MGRRGETLKEILRERARLTVIEKKLAGGGVESRTHFARWVCSRFHLEDARGELRVGSCLRALRDFEEEGRIELPERLLDINGAWKPRRLSQAVTEPSGVPDSVADVAGLELLCVEANDGEAVRTWNELIIREHPQGERRLVGRQLRYLVNSAHGVLGAVAISASALRLSAREAWIGWEQWERREHLDRILNLSRLLIRPSVRCRNLASWVLGACARRVGDDFERRYGYAPWILESFVENEEHRGTCFQAANWQCIGQTRGRGRNDRQGRCAESIKDIYVYPLVKDFRQRMGVGAERGKYPRPLAVHEGQESDTWIEQEFGTIELGDKRLRDRLITIVGDRIKQPSASYLQGCGGDRGAAKAYYNFIDHGSEEVSPEAMLATHRERSIERMMSQKVVLVVQDTSDLRFKSRPQTTGLGDIGTNQTGAKAKGLKLHTSLALSEEGLPLGVLRSTAYAEQYKDEKEKESSDRPIEEKKSFRWIVGHRDCVTIAKQMPDTHIISVMDREADFFELFAEAAPTRHRVGLLVRAKYDRRLDGSMDRLFETLRESKNTATIEVEIPRQRSHQANRGKGQREALAKRSARLTVSFEDVSIPPTGKDADSKEPVALCGVYAWEKDPPPNAAPIQWRLLTTEKVTTLAEATRMLELYARRWRIEDWHRILKSGCKVQEHQNHTAERLKRAIAIDAVLAWRIQLMILLGREVPDLPADLFFDQGELTVLAALHQERTNEKRAEPFSLGEAVTRVAQIGGYLARRSDPPPGAEVLWKGLLRLSGMVVGYRLALAQGP